jgi:hypothetical protein
MREFGPIEECLGYAKDMMSFNNRLIPQKEI